MISSRRYLILIFLTTCVTGCAGLPTEEEILTSEPVHTHESAYTREPMYTQEALATTHEITTYSNETFPEPERYGVYHKVKTSETLWRIAAAYDVPLDDIIHSNNIPDVAQLEENQLIFIPGTHTVLDITLEEEEFDSDFMWPLQGDVISHFHSHHDGGDHKGLNIRAPHGSTVKAARSGQVVFADHLSGYGKTVVLRHTGGFHSVYSLNSDILVKVGNRVKKGSPLAYVGQANSEAYLHFQIRKNSLESNPLHYLP